MATPVEELLATIKAQEDEDAQSTETNDYQINEQLTYGPIENSLSGTYAANGGAWNVHIVNKISIDVALIYQSMLGQMHKKTNSTNLTPPIDRKIKDKLLKDYFPVHTIQDIKGQ